MTNRQSFVGSPETIAATMEDFVEKEASDGFILVPHITPSGLDEFADRVVPILQERGTFRADYDGPTLRAPSWARRAAHAASDGSGRRS